MEMLTVRCLPEMRSSQGTRNRLRGTLKVGRRSSEPGRDPLVYILASAYDAYMGNRVIHISDADAASDFTSLLDRVRAGEEVVIEHDARPVAVLSPADSGLGRLLSESVALAEAHAKEMGYEPVMDADFAADLEEIIKSRKPRNLPPWD